MSCVFDFEIKRVYLSVDEVQNLKLLLCLEKGLLLSFLILISVGNWVLKKKVVVVFMYFQSQYVVNQSGLDRRDYDDVFLFIYCVVCYLLKKKNFFFFVFLN